MFTFSPRNIISETKHFNERSIFVSHLLQVFEMYAFIIDSWTFRAAVTLILLRLMKIQPLCVHK